MAHGGPGQRGEYSYCDGTCLAGACPARRRRAESMDRTRLPRLVLLVTTAVIAAACTTAAPALTFVPVAPATPGAVQAGSQNGVLGTVNVTAADLSFDPANTIVDKAGAYLLELHNTGALEHNITLPDGKVLTAKPGETSRMVVQVPADGLMFSCSIPGHAQAGMQGMIMVAGSAEATQAPTGGGNQAAPAPSADPNAPPYT